LQSDAYSKAAGLGDPKDKKTPPAFNGLGYSGVYDSNIVGEPTSITVKQLWLIKLCITVSYFVTTKTLVI